MANWFYNPNIPFDMWSPVHLFTLLIIVGLLISVFLFRQQLIPFRRPIRMTVGILLILSRLSLDIWYIVTKQWSVHSSLPLELCSIASLLAAVMLLTNSHFLFEVLYFIGIGGAMMAVLTLI